MQRHPSVSTEESECRGSEAPIDLSNMANSGEFTNNKICDRAKLLKLHPDEHSLVFQLVEITTRDIDKKLQIQMFGVTSDGNSVCCKVNGFSPYFYSTLPSGLQDKSCEVIRKQLNALAVDQVDRYSLFKYEGDEMKRFLKITMPLNSNLKVAQDCLRQYDVKIQFYEADVHPIMRFMVDTEIDGCSWVEFPPKTWRTSDPCISFCQIEVETDYKTCKFISHKSEGKWAVIAPLRVLSLDIIDEQVQIANIIFNQGKPSPILKKVYVLNGCDPIIGVDVINFNKKQEMLQAWYNFIQNSDPDIITGYGIHSYDLTKLGRFRSVTENERSVHAIGRVVFDLRKIIQNDFKLRSDSFSAVSHYFFGRHKNNFNSKTIAELLSQTSQTRQRLAKYSMENAALSMKLYNKMLFIVNHIEISRISGVTLKTAINNGQIIKVYSQLLRVAKSRDFILPVRSEGKENKNFQRSEFETKVGYFQQPIAVLDFASMSANIMITYNLCYSTLLDTEYCISVDRWCSPSGCEFVKSHVRKGLFPEILETLLIARKSVRQALEAERDRNKKKLLNIRHSAIKLLANAVYGFTGASKGRTLPCLDVAKTIIAYGTNMIREAQQKIESIHTRNEQFENDSRIIYRDTDSVMVNFDVKTIEKCIELGRKAGECLSFEYPGTITLEFKKVYCPLLLIAKNKYAGLKYTQPDSHDGIEMKGMETICRDTSPLVANMMNTCLQKLLIERNPEGAVNYAKQIMSDLLCNRIDISQLVITKELAKTDYAAKQAHVELANKMKKRDPGTAPKLGDRVPYVICCAAKNTPAYMKAEDPIFALENCVPIDSKYYLDNQLTKPLLRIFEPILGDKAESILLKGEHTRTRTVVTSKVGALAAFTKKKETCLGCKALLPNGYEKNALCPHCESKRSALYQLELSAQRTLEESFSRLWTECQRCQGSLHEEVLCMSRDCPILYMRKKIQIDLDAQQKRVVRFSVPSW